MPAEPVTPGNGQGTQEGTAFDFEHGYNELRPQFTRVTQDYAAAQSRLSEYDQIFNALQDESTRAAALEALGFELETSTPQGASGGSAASEFTDPLEEDLHNLRAEVAELRSQREQDAAEAEQAKILDLRNEYIDEAIDYIAGETKQKFTDQEEAALGNLAIAMTDDKGVPDVQGAYNILFSNEGILEQRRQQWIQSKTGAQQPPLGSTIPADKKPKTARERVQYMDERVRAMEAQQ